MGRPDARARRGGLGARTLDALAPGARSRRADRRARRRARSGLPFDDVPDPDLGRHRQGAARARARRALRAARSPSAADARDRRGVPPAADAGRAARLSPSVHPVPARGLGGRLAAAHRGRRRGGGRRLQRGRLDVRPPPRTTRLAGGDREVARRRRGVERDCRRSCGRVQARNDERSHDEPSLCRTARHPRAGRAPDSRAAAARRARRRAVRHLLAATRPPRSGRTSTGRFIRRSAAACPGAVWLASREHVDSFSDLPDELAARFRPCRGARRAGGALAR